MANRRMGLRHAAIALAVLIVGVLLVLALWSDSESRSVVAPPTPTPSASGSAPVLAPPSPAAPATPPTSLAPLPLAPPSQSPSPSATSLADQECAVPDGGFVPTRYTIDRVGAHERVVSLPTQGGTIPAPPLNERRTAAWWNEGPSPGAERGKAVLTIHTYRPSLRPALGNELYDGGRSALVPGDVIKLHGASGEIACYEFVEAPRIFVADYDPSSTVMIDPSGDPSLVIVICWDFSARTSHWDSRVMFQFEPLGG